MDLEDIYFRNLLDLAISDNNKALVEILLEANYPIIGAKQANLTSIDAAFALQYSDILELLLKKIDLTLQDYFKIKHIATILGASGIFHGFHLEGNKKQYSPFILAKCLQTFLNTSAVSAYFSQEDLNYLNFLASNLEINVNKSAEELIEEMKKGFPILLFTGWSGHSVTVSFWYDLKEDCFYFSKNNKGEGALHIGIETFKVQDPSKLKNALDRLRTTRDFSQKESYLYCHLEKDLEAINTENFLMKPQKNSNCCWTNASVGWLSILFLFQKRKLEEASLEERIKGKQNAILIYKKFINHSKRLAYEILIDSNPIENELKRVLKPQYEKTLNKQF